MPADTQPRATARESGRRPAHAVAAALVVAMTVGCSVAPPTTSPSMPPASALGSPVTSVRPTPTPDPTTTPPPTPPTPTGWSRVPTQASVSGVQFQRVVWTGTRFVATASALGGDGAFLDSADGLTWNRQETKSADQMPVAIAAGPRGVVAIGAMDDQVATWSSPDGLNWTARLDAFPLPARATQYSGQTRFSIDSVVATSDGWLAVGREDPLCQLDCGVDPVRPLVWTSTDGLAWASVPDGAGLGSGGMTTVARSRDGFVAVGLGRSRAAVWTSPDGTTWSPVADDPMFHSRPGTDPTYWVEMTGVAADHGVVVAVGMDGPQGGGDDVSVRAWWSTDGRTWSEANGEGFLSGQVFGLTSTPAGFLATGPSGPQSCLGGMWESADGRDWVCVADDPSFSGFGPYAAAAAPSVVVAVGLDAGAPDSDQGNPGAVWRKLLP